MPYPGNAGHMSTQQRADTQASLEMGGWAGDSSLLHHVGLLGGIPSGSTCDQKRVLQQWWGERHGGKYPGGQVPASGGTTQLRGSGSIHLSLW